MLRHLLALAAAAALALPAPVAIAAPAPAWVGVWGAPPAFPTGPEMNKQTVRQVMRLSLGGRRVRIRLSNEMGTTPVVIGAAHLARPGDAPGSIDPATDHVLTFGGHGDVTIPPGAPVLSDPVTMNVAALDRLSISLFVPRYVGPTATHPLGRATAFIVPGDQTGAASLSDPKRSTERFFVSGIEVEQKNAGAVIALGDSITDGYGSTIDADRRWPDILAERLNGAHKALSVVDAGISGNRVLHDLPEAVFGPSALSRVDRDVLSVPGAKVLIVMESINDIGHPSFAGLPEQAVSAGEIEAGLAQIVERARAHGLRVFGATLTPYGGTTLADYFTAEGETKRQAVNDWIRHSGTFDGVIDFDAVLRDPAHPDRMLPALDFGDHLHPNDAGYRRMADAIDLDRLAVAP